MTGLLHAAIASALAFAAQDEVTITEHCPRGLVSGTGHEGRFTSEEEQRIREHLAAGGPIRILMRQLWFDPVAIHERQGSFFAESRELHWDPHSTSIRTRTAMGGEPVEDPTVFLVGTDGTMQWIIRNELAMNRESANWCLQ